MPGLILIAGSLAQRPGQGGHTWVFLQYLLGFRKLGYDVIFVDWLAPAMCQDDHGNPCAWLDSRNVASFRQVFERFGLADSFSLTNTATGETLGIPRRRLLERARSADFLLNIMGFLQDPEILAAVPRRVFLDIDPGFGQMWHELGLHDLFAGHDAFVTVGLNVGQPDCTVPTCGLPWIATPQPVVLDLWPASPPPPGPFTSVASWRGLFGPIDYRGQTYGLRVHEFRKFMTLPARTGQPFHLALDIHPSETKDLAALAQNHWQLIDPQRAAGDPWLYQTFIRDSLAEFTVAKNMYVQTRSGWFSDRSICYLATGRPVLAQETGFSAHLPSGRGLLCFSTMDEAIAGVEQIAANPLAHGRAARALAEEYFASSRVLARLVDRLAATPTRAAPQTAGGPRP